VLTVSNNIILGLFKIPAEHEPVLVSEDEVKYLIREGRKDRRFEPSEEDLIHSVFKFTDTVVREVMVPAPISWASAPAATSMPFSEP